MLWFSHSVVSDSLWPYELKHTRLPCPSLSPRVCSNSCPLSWWCHPTISSLVTHFSSCLQYFSASWFFPVSQLFTSGDQSIGVSDSASVLPMNIQGSFPFGWLIWSLCCPRDSQESSPTLQFKSINSSVLSFLCGLYDVVGVTFIICSFSTHACLQTRPFYSVPWFCLSRPVSTGFNYCELVSCLNVRERPVALLSSSVAELSWLVRQCPVVLFLFMLD